MSPQPRDTDNRPNIDLPTPVLILDGGLGTSLQDKYHVPFNAETPLWSSHLLLSDSGRATLLQAQSDFTSVPVDILSTATYQVSIEGFARTRSVPSFPDGITSSAIPEFLEAAVDIAASACAAGCDEGDSHRAAKIALSLGPYGATMVPSTEYSGAYDQEHDDEPGLREWHAQRLRLFAEESVVGRSDYVAFETVPRVDEIIAIRKAVSVMWAENSEGSSGWGRKPPFWISCVFTGDGDQLPDGSSIKEVVEAALVPLVAEATPFAIGINCTKIAKLPALIGLFEEAVDRMKEAGSINVSPGLVLYPDGTNGEVYNTTTQTWEVPQGQCHPSVPWEQQFSEVIKTAAARKNWAFIILGGCCKSTHEDIRKLRSLLSMGTHAD